MPEKVSCPVCEEIFELDDDLEVNDKTVCPACESALTVVSLDPALVEEAADYDRDSDAEEDNLEDE